MLNLRARSVAVSLVVLTALPGCSTMKEWFSKSDPDAVVDSRTADAIYAEAKELMSDGNYDRASKLYEKLEAKYPYGRYAQQAQLEIAYCYYKMGEQAQAAAAIERFIKLHPNHPSVDYAYYMKGVIYFAELKGVAGVIASQDMTERDPQAQLTSFESFKELVTRFPNSKYAEDARDRMAYLINSLASHEMHVARYYQSRGAYLAAANRAQAVIKNYPKSPAVEESLGILIYSYDQLGMKDLSGDARRVLELNFPKSPYLANAAPVGRPWWKVW
ncbi:outer membrane protein assembly factor BamD [Niveibacterium sp. SC-1]|uniref:outer membrane protein assembly factor BamD n=1 Tax=Niveibacterium sp. SC-1 TaxID=3135646 RepID=UPI00311DA385